MADNEHTNSKNVQGFVTVILRLVERWDEIWQVHGENPVVPKNEPEEEEEAEGQVDVVFVSVLPPGIFVVVVIINHNRLGEQLPHPGRVVQQKGHLETLGEKRQ